jgi:hypothetical protein
MRTLTVYDDSKDSEDMKGKLFYWDSEEYNVGFCTDQDFGCIHFKRKEK